MAQSIFTQVVCVLLNGSVSVQEVEAALHSFNLVGKREAAERGKDGGALVLVGFRLEVNGYVYRAWCHQRGYVCFIEELHGWKVEGEGRVLVWRSIR